MAENSNAAVAEAPVQANPNATMPLPVDRDPVLTPEQEQKRNEVVKMIQSIGGQVKAVRMPLSQVYVNRSNNIRMEASYDEASINSMMDQIKTAGGLIQPIVVIPMKPTADNDNKEFGLIIGFRRSIALKRLEAENPSFTASVPVIIAEGVKSHAAIRMLQILENKGRKDLSSMEEALCIKNILDDNKANFSQHAVAKMLGYTDSQVSKLLSFLQFPEEIQEAINDGSLSFSNADRLRRDIPASQWAATLPTAIAKSTKDFERYADEVKAKYNPEAATTDGESTDDSSSSGSQKPATMLRSKIVQETYIPFLKGLAGTVDGTEKKYTEADIVAARIDTFKAVLLDSESNMSKLIAPHLAEQKAKEDQEKAQEEATSKAKTFWKQKVLDAEELVKLSSKPDPKDPDKKPILLAQAYVSVINDVYALPDEEKAKLGFELPKTTAEAAQVLRNRHLEIEKDREESKKTREAKKLETAAKEAAEKEAAERAKADAGLPHEASPQPATDPNPNA